MWAPMHATAATSRRTELGVFAEFSQDPGMREAVAFEQAMAEGAAVEGYGYDAVWLAEIQVQIVTSLPWMFVSEAGGDDRSDILLPSAHRLVRRARPNRACFQGNDIWLGPCVRPCPKGCDFSRAPEIVRGDP